MKSKGIKILSYFITFLGKSQENIHHKIVWNYISWTNKKIIETYYWDTLGFQAIFKPGEQWCTCNEPLLFWGKSTWITMAIIVTKVNLQLLKNFHDREIFPVRACVVFFLKFSSAIFRRVLRVSMITFVGRSAYRCNICMWLRNKLWDSNLQTAHAHASYWSYVLVLFLFKVAKQKLKLSEVSWAISYSRPIHIKESNEITPKTMHDDPGWLT